MFDTELVHEILDQILIAANRIEVLPGQIMPTLYSSGSC